ncbi:hypothetical protein [Myroides odoratimimus]|uniref:Uncharacterized protein n=1 Tax=Myroides odoratimimus TaxID=76832 RepID=A0AAI8C3F5_9FLAO|nr:hypothetical protein [Myroides odoratimimus]ALU25953.1 hypothetical protein AS202_07265 [Myroides odoratimimus]EHO14202.1 hypothetical protein HMPREF9714_00464 [Myroides odoratimimus CCUG 12901]MDM1033103.1 hypothetical protein [Myroides odoratimimus]MDM1038722.1 hypothetical protein [Myroides odoratimimus]MDM1052836.1 hypothetical protein [Myroides odoratimimus]
MKRILFLFLGLSLLASCSSDDNAVVDDEKLGELVVKIEQKNYYVGDKVSIKVESQKGEEVKGARIFIDETQVNALYEFMKPGDFKVVAKKAGYTSSKVVDIKVKAYVNINLSVKESKVIVGNKIVFDVLNDSKETVAAKIYHVESGTEIEGTEYTPTEIGVYTFVARGGEGYKESNKITVEVLADTSYFWIGDKSYEIHELTFDIIQYKYKSGVNDRVYLLNGKTMNAVEINVWNINGEAANNMSITVFIPNPTIKVNSKNQITDFGQRVSLSDSSEWIVRSVFLMLEGEDAQSYEVNEDRLTDITLKTKGLVIPNNGVGAGKKGVESQGEFDFKAFGDKEMKLLFNGDFTTTEAVKMF